jgi:membrane protease YdiL (CAAX protease family)
VTRLVIFVAALFAAPWIVNWALEPFLPPPSGDLSSHLLRFVPGVWTPTLLALLFVAAEDGVAGVKKELAARLRHERGTGRWLMLAAVLPAVAVIVAVVAARAAGHGAPFMSADGIPLMIGVQIITGAVGEELGWRGYLLPRLRRLVSVTASFWIMGALWSLWHLPAFFTPGMPHVFMPATIVLPSIAFVGVFLGFVFNRAGESVLATMAAHLSMNIMMGLGGAAFSSAVYWGVVAAFFGAAAVLITTRHRSPLPAA